MKKLISTLSGPMMAICAVTFFPAPYVVAQTVEAQSADYDSMSTSDLEKLAKKKDARAAMTLADKYWDDKEWADASKWYKKALGKDYVENLSNNEKALAMYRYGEMKLRGRGGNTNTKEGYKYISEAADLGNGDAMYEMYNFLIGGLIDYGDRANPQTIVKKDFRAAYEWKKKAAWAGNDEALVEELHALGYDYKNYETRMKLLESAATNGNIRANNELGFAYGEPSRKNYNYEKAKYYFTKAGNEEALQKLEKSNNYFLETQAREEAARREDQAREEAARREAQARQQEELKKVNDLVARGNQGDAGAWNELAIYYKGKNNYAEAIKYFRKAADLGNGAAAYNLAELYYAGKGVEKNRTEAFNLYKKAEANGLANDPDVLYSLGFMYSRGQGVAANSSLATTYLNKAVKAGSKSAKEELDHIAKSELTTRKATNYKVLNHSYVFSYDGYKAGVRFDPNGKLVYTVYAMGKDRTSTGTWHQNGTEISTSVGTFWLDSNGNLNVYDRDGVLVTGKRIK